MTISLGKPGSLAFPVPTREPVVRQEDAAEFRHALFDFQAGIWDEDRWKTFRLRHGVYAENRPGRHMIRVKIPGGSLSFDQARAVADVNRRLCDGEIHLTTRQDIQLYGIDLPGTASVIQDLADGDLTTRESSGATFRNVTTCPLAGMCPKEHTDASAVAERITTSWIRHPLVQHMPRKFKTTVSGCAADCGYARFDDLGFVAVEQDGRKGFTVYAGGGLGSQSRVGVMLESFVDEGDLPAVQEAIARVHHAYSNRENRNRSRIKFLVDKFGEEGFREKFREEFARIRNLPRRPWTPLDWRAADADAPIPDGPGRIVEQHDGKAGLVIRPDLGRVPSDTMDDLVTMLEAVGAEGFRLTRDQNLVVIGLPIHEVQNVAAAVVALGLPVPQDPTGVTNIASCPGTETCPIGITNSSAFAKTLLSDPRIAAGPELRIRVSGCHNGCGQHHLADIGLHGFAKKIDGMHVPHYRFHYGAGSDRAPTLLPIQGGSVPAHHARAALGDLVNAYGAGREEGESFFNWVQRVGKKQVNEILKPHAAVTEPEAGGYLIDIGKKHRFHPPAETLGECAAPAVIAEYLADLARVGHWNMKRSLSTGDTLEALAFARQGMIAAARRLLTVAGHSDLKADDDAVIAGIRDTYPATGTVGKTLSQFLRAEETAKEAGRFDTLDEILWSWIRLVEIVSEARIQGSRAREMIA